MREDDGSEGAPLLNILDELIFIIAGNMAGAPLDFDAFSGFRWHAKEVINPHLRAIIKPRHHGGMIGGDRVRLKRLNQGAFDIARVDRLIDHINSCPNDEQRADYV